MQEMPQMQIWSLGWEDPLIFPMKMGNGNALQYSFLEISMDREAWRVSVHEAAKVKHDWADMYMYVYVKWIQPKKMNTPFHTK